jgi:RNA polymerase sigma factor (sigma-70 family)
MKEHDYITTKYLVRMLKKARYEHIPGYEPGDLLSELYLALHHALPNFKGLNGANQKTYAETVMRNRITDLARIAKTKKRTTKVIYSELGLSPLGERIYSE